MTDFPTGAPLGPYRNPGIIDSLERARAIAERSRAAKAAGGASMEDVEVEDIVVAPLVEDEHTGGYMAHPPAGQPEEIDGQPVETVKNVGRFL